MLKLTKKADYGLIAVRHLAEHADLGACSAKDLAEMYGVLEDRTVRYLAYALKQGRCGLGRDWDCSGQYGK